MFIMPVEKRVLNSNIEAGNDHTAGSHSVTEVTRTAIKTKMNSDERV